MLEPLPGNSTIEKTPLFVENYGQGYPKEAFRTFGISVNGIQQQLKRLEDGGIVVGYLEGRTRPGKKGKPDQDKECGLKKRVKWKNSKSFRKNSDVLASTLRITDRLYQDDFLFGTQVHLFGKTFPVNGAHNHRRQAF